MSDARGCLSDVRRVFVPDVFIQRSHTFIVELSLTGSVLHNELHVVPTPVELNDVYGDTPLSLPSTSTPRCRTGKSMFG